MSDKFSVLISVYHKETPAFLISALQSVYNQQTVKPSEIVLIKDGVLGKELEDTIIALKKQTPVLKVYGYIENKGLGYALNYGLERCSNELVFRMDADDISKPDRFQKQLVVFRTHPETVIVGSYIEEFNSTIGDLKRIRKVPLHPIDIQKHKVMRNPFNHMTVGFKKTKIIEVGSYIDMPGYEDYYLWLRLLRKSHGINLNEPLVYARVGNNMIARRQGLSFLLNEIHFQKTLKSENLISGVLFLQNLCLRAIPRLFPKRILNIIYRKVLRK